MIFTINITTKSREELVDITEEVQNILKKAKIDEGVCIIFSPHTTAGLIINENADPSVKDDILDHLKQLVPKNKNYSHLEGNADAHIKSSIVGNSLVVIVSKGNLALGTWQGIYFCEFDGPRKRSVWVKILT
ncbi:MAG: secondary thiamine-phosphate synthase enzyme YjbQ [Candidatus Omnitrophica bacterium]|nr:secondary thiamine-phosphate synthase enzyme YjbQ [Candidatus Omnitrophota bacterium]